MAAAHWIAEKLTEVQQVKAGTQETQPAGMPEKLAGKLLAGVTVRLGRKPPGAFQ